MLKTVVSASPGGAFAIIREGKVIYSKITGLANVEHQLPIADTTVFNIASNSKQFTTLLALFLEEEGKLSMADDVRDYLPELSELPRKITVRQLANHTHGLPNVDELAALEGLDQLSHDQVLDMLFHIREFNYLPGEDYDYSNTGYVLLSEIIERIGEKPFESQLKEKIFDPVGMVNSNAVGDYLQVIPQKAYSYSPAENGFVNNPVTSSTMGASGVYASLNDLISWAQYFLTGDNAYKKLLKRMQEPTLLNSGKIIDYGMGLQFENYKGVDIVFHGGGTESYRSYVLYAPDHDLSLIFLSNAGGISSYGLIYSSLDILLEEDLENQPVGPFKTNHFPNYEGTYALNPGQYYTILATNDSLFIRSYGTEEKTHLPQLDEHTFIFPDLPFAKLIFFEDRFDLRFVDFTYPAKRVAAPQTEGFPGDLHRFVGTYTNKAHQVNMELALVNDQLVVNPNNENIPLSRSSQSVFYAAGSSFGKIEFKMDEGGSVASFKLSRSRISNLTFTKEKPAVPVKTFGW